MNVTKYFENVVDVKTYLESTDLSEFSLADQYDIYFACACILRGDRKVSKEESCKHAQKVLDWLHSTDFYTAPASSRYHDSIIGGLCAHSIKTAYRILDLIKCDAFSTRVTTSSAILCALIHDWCKIGLYEPYKRNVKNEQTGQWEQVDAFRIREVPFSCMGHGVSSMFLAQKFFKLSTEEALAIRWHQGRWNVCEAEQNEFQQANENFPLVHLLQFADQLAIVNY